MAVVIIMGLLAGIVGVAIFGQLDTARVNTTRTQMKQLESALTFYQMDNGRFPTTEQGLQALVEPPTSGPEPRNYRPGGYLQGGDVPADAWSNDLPVRVPRHQQHRELRHLVARRRRPAGRQRDRRRHRQLGGDGREGRMSEAPPARASDAAFTLIELLAVLLIMALVAGLTLPNLSLGAERVVLGEAQDLASTFAFTRQRAVATGSPRIAWSSISTKPHTGSRSSPRSPRRSGSQRRLPPR